MEIIKDNRCIIYCRVSSKEQEERGYSLEAQEKLLCDYAHRNELVISKIFKISESASGKQIRKTFNEMLAYIKKRKINIILCEKIDRLTRNLKDGAVISDWISADSLRQVHFVKENFIVSQNTKAHENLVWDMKVAIARFYTNNLSEEVRKGQRAKIEAGWIPCGQKFGYMTVGDKGHKIQVPNEKVAPYVKRAFELYNSNNYTLKRLKELLDSEGMLNKRGRPVNKSALHRILTDPFYCGTLIWGDKEYPGKHEALISESLFSEVQEKLKRPYKVGSISKHFHVFKGLIRCADCGSLITWETQKGHHYGHCKGFKPCNKQGYVRQEVIEEQLDELMKRIKPANKNVLNWINEALKEKHQDKKDYSKNTRENLNKELMVMENRLDKLYEDKLDGNISADYYQKKSKEFQKKKKDVLEEFSKLENRIENYYEIGIEIHELAFRAEERYHSNKAGFDDKRTLINRIFCDLKLGADNELEAKYTPAFEFLAEWMPKLNATSELLKISEDKRKTGSLEPACPMVLPGWDSNPRPID